MEKCPTCYVFFFVSLQYYPPKRNMSMTNLQMVVLTSAKSLERSVCLSIDTIYENQFFKEFYEIAILTFRKSFFLKFFFNIFFFNFFIIVWLIS